MSLEKHGSTWLGRMLDRKVKNKKENELIDRLIDETCTCTPSYQVIGCSAYKYGKCYWNPENDPYDLKNRHWVDGKFVKKDNTEQSI